MSTKLRRHLLADINKAELYAGLQPICHTTQFLYTVGCLTGYPQEMCVAIACTLSLCSFPAPNPNLRISINKLFRIKTGSYKNWAV